MVELLISVLILLAILALVHYVGAFLGLSVEIRGLVMVIIIIIFLIYALKGKTFAQVQPLLACDTIAPGTTFVVASGTRPFVYWLMDAQVPANPPTDMTMVNQRINGFYLQLNSLTRIDTGTLMPSVCPAGNTNAGKLAYGYQYPTPIPTGKHTISVRPWNFVLNNDTTPTTTRQEGVLVSIPFTVVDVFHTGPPLGPSNLSIVR